MATIDLSKYDINAVPDATNMVFGIVVSDWNEQVTHNLLKGAYETLTKHGAKEENIHVLDYLFFEILSKYRAISCSAAL
jgi:6,7-dimethyl-8-ribityllumazine synthase